MKQRVNILIISGQRVFLQLNQLKNSFKRADRQAQNNPHPAPDRPDTREPHLHDG